MKRSADEDIESYLAKLKPIINKRIEKWIPRGYDEKSLEFVLGRPRYKNSVETSTKGVTEPIWEFLDRGGKRWRPALMILIAEALGLKGEDILDFAIIPEVVHNGSLVVDDIEDNSDMRRGKPSLHKIFGVDIAINAGNTMYFLPLLVLLKNSKLASDKVRKLYDVVVQEMISVSFGQAIDIVWHKGGGDSERISEEQYLQMCAYKTGAPVRMSAKMGAILAGATAEQTESVAEFAETIGVAFQIQDDILNILAGDKWGKEFGEDIKEGKHTLLVIHTLQKASDADRKKLLEILRMHTNDRALLEAAVAIIKKYGSLEYAKDYARNMVKNSWERMDKVLPDSSSKETLRSFANFLVERDL
ncbi:MAG: polyprenyl synthetase family protein [Candidatus Aenigmatarchaeota archaeon]